jgi:hypothetical protein
MWETEARRKRIAEMLDGCVCWCKRWLPRLVLVILGFALGWFA